MGISSPSRQWQLKIKNRSRRDAIVNAYASSMTFHSQFAESQSQSDPSGRMRHPFAEPLKNHGLFGGGNSRARVADFHAQSVLKNTSVDRDASSDRRMFSERYKNKIVHYYRPSRSLSP